VLTTVKCEHFSEHPYDDTTMMKCNNSVSGNINAGLQSASKSVMVHLEDEKPAIPCNHTGNSNTSVSEAGNGDYISDNVLIQGDTVMVQFEDETLVDSLLPDIRVLDYATIKVIGDRADHTPSKEHGSQTDAVKPTERKDTIVPDSIDDTGQVTEETVIHHIQVPSSENSCIGEPEHRLPDDDDTRPVAVDNTTCHQRAPG